MTATKCYLTVSAFDANNLHPQSTPRHPPKPPKYWAKSNFTMSYWFFLEFNWGEDNDKWRGGSSEQAGALVKLYLIETVQWLAKLICVVLLEKHFRTAGDIWPSGSRCNAYFRNYLNYTCKTSKLIKMKNKLSSEIKNPKIQVHI